MSQIRDFSGGLNTRVDPSLIGPNQSVMCINNDTEKVSLTSLKSSLATSEASNLNGNAYRFVPRGGNPDDLNEVTWLSSTNRRDYAPYVQNLYFNETGVDKIQRYDGTNTRDVGLPSFNTSMFSDNALTNPRRNLDRMYYMATNLNESTGEVNEAGLDYLNTNISWTVTPAVEPTITADTELKSYWFFAVANVSTQETMFDNADGDRLTRHLIQGYRLVLPEDYSLNQNFNFRFVTNFTGDFPFFTAGTTGEYSVQFFVADEDDRNGNFTRIAVSTDGVNGFTHTDDSMNIDINRDLNLNTLISGGVVDNLPNNPREFLRFSYLDENQGERLYSQIYQTEIVSASPLSESGSVVRFKIDWDVNTRTDVDEIRMFHNLANVEGSYGWGVTTTTDDYKTFDLNVGVLEFEAARASQGVALSGVTQALEPVDNLVNLIVHDTHLVASRDNLIYWSNADSPDTWDTSSDLIFPFDVTGLLSIQEGLLVFTRGRTYVVGGNLATSYNGDPLNITQAIYTIEQGCIDHKTTGFIKSRPLWMSEDGLCTLASGYVEVLSKPMLGKFTPEGTIINSAVFDEQYYLLTTTKIYKFDFRYGFNVTEVDVGDNLQDLATFNDHLYGIQADGTPVRLFEGSEDLSITYWTGDLVEFGYSIDKNADTFYVRYNGSFTLQFYLDGTQVGEDYVLSNTENNAELKIPAEAQRNYALQIRITGTGIFNEIQFKEVPRKINV